MEARTVGRYTKANDIIETLDLMAADLVEVKNSLQTLAANYPGLDIDPLFYEPLETITEILEEIE
jgi:hypothetical protein